MGADEVSHSEDPPNEAVALIQALSGQARIMEIDELERRVTQLEKAFGAS